MGKFSKFFACLLFLSLVFCCLGFSFFEASPTKILLIGLDGATWKVIRLLAEEGKLPNISYLMREGVYWYLDSISPVVSAAIWTSIATGKGHEKHGILDWAFYSDRLKKIVPYKSYHCKTKAVWNILSQNNKKVGLYSWLITYPQRLAPLLNKIPLYENSAKFEVDSQWERSIIAIIVCCFATTAV